jgi:hypothetical protein
MVITIMWINILSKVGSKSTIGLDVDDTSVLTVTDNTPESGHGLNIKHLIVSITKPIRLVLDVNLVSVTYTSTTIHAVNARTSSNEHVKYSHVWVPENTTIISKNAFQLRIHNKTKHLHLPQKLICISDHAFSANESIIHIQLPACILYIGASAFMSCKHLKSVTTLSDNGADDCKTVIANNAFSNNMNLTSCTLPQNIAYIARDAFKGNTNLTTFQSPGCPTLYDIAKVQKTKYLDAHIYRILDGQTKRKGALTKWILAMVQHGACATRAHCTFEKFKSHLPDYLNVSAFAADLYILTLNRVHVDGWDFHDAMTYLLGCNRFKIHETAFSKCNHLSTFTIPTNIKFVASNNVLNGPSLKSTHTKHQIYITGGKNDIFSNVGSSLCNAPSCSALQSSTTICFLDMDINPRHIITHCNFGDSRHKHKRVLQTTYAQCLKNLE